MLTGGGERAAVARTWSDEHLEFWGDFYQDNPTIRARGVLFEFFLAHPVPVLIALNIACPVPRPSPSRQLARLLAALERGGARCSNGTVTEKLRRRRIKRSRDRRRDIDGMLL